MHYTAMWHVYNILVGSNSSITTIMCQKVLWLDGVSVLTGKVQIQGNLIHTHSCVSRIARVEIRVPTILYAGTCKPIISIA